MIEMCEEKCCCNCSHCARWRTKNGIECHCDLTDKFLCYVDVMAEDINCKHWEKETSFDLQEEHDAEIMENERRKFAEWLAESKKVIDCSKGYLRSEEILEEYEKEVVKNE